MLRRFENFRMGALTATRLNAMIDAIESVQREVRQRSAEAMVARPTILCRIKGNGTPSKETCSAPQVVSYPFEQVFLGRTPTGALTAQSCVSVDVAEDAISSGIGASLVEFSKSPNFENGDVVAAMHVHGALQAGVEPAQMVYAICSPKVAKGEMRLARITQLTGPRKYKGVVLGTQPAEEIEFVNIYEAEEYYGATTASIQCAQITPRRLSVGHVVWVQKVKGETGVGNTQYPDPVNVTCAPNAFDSVCTCGPVTGAGATQMVTDAGGIGADAAAASLIMQRVMQPV